MGRRFLAGIIGLIACFCMSLSCVASETMTLDPTHTFVLWHINHLGFSSQSGKWYANGTLVLDREKPQNSKVDVKIDVNNMVTGLPELDKHLKGKLFFDTDQYPEATFVSDKVTLVGKSKAKVHGILTLHGVSKPVVLDVVLNKSGVNPLNEKVTAGFSAKTTLKRSDFGMKALLPMLGDEVKIEIEAEANQPKA